MVRYVSGPKKRHVESQIYDCDGQITISMIAMGLSGLLLLISLLCSIGATDDYILFSDGFFFIAFLVAFLIYDAKSKEMKKLQIELEEVKDDVELDISALTYDETLDVLVKSIIREEQQNQ